MSSASTALGIDLGTTAIKAAIVDRLAGTVLASASKSTNAYDASACARSPDPERKEQDVHVICSSIEAAVAELPAEIVAKCSHIALCDQMHGVVLWRSTDLVASRLITWEDGRCNSDWLAGVNSTIWAASRGETTPLFSGYGCATLTWLLEHQAELFVGSRAFDRAGTIGSYVAARLTRAGSGSSSPSASSPGLGYIDATDAASWGCFDAVEGCWNKELAGKLHAGLPGLLPVVVPAGTVVGTVSHGCDSVGGGGRPRTSPFAALAGKPVTVSIGDHPAGVVSVLDWARRRQRPEPEPGRGDGRGAIAIVNIGTSAQIALVDGPSASILNSSAAPPPTSVASAVRLGSMGRLPDGCEVRPFPATAAAVAASVSNSHGSVSSQPQGVMLVGASRNGGNLLAAAVALLAPRVHEISEQDDDGRAVGGRLDDVYLYLERDAASISFEEASNIYVALPLPERRPIGFGKASSSQPTPTDSHASSTRSLADLCADPRLTPGHCYAVAAANVVRTVLDRIPAAALSTCGISCTIGCGGALAKSAMLRRFLSAGLDHRYRAAVECAGLQKPGPIRVLLLPDELAGYAGAVGTALIQPKA